MEKKSMMIAAAVVAACCCSSSSAMCAYYTGIFGSMLAAVGGSPAATQASQPSVARGSTSKICWPDQKADASCPGKCRNNKDGKCGGARKAVWDGSQWKACAWSGSGDNFDCTKTCDTGANC